MHGHSSPKTEKRKKALSSRHQQKSELIWHLQRIFQSLKIQSLQTVSDTIIGILVFGCAFSTKSPRTYPVLPPLRHTPLLPFEKKKRHPNVPENYNKNMNGSKFNVHVNFEMQKKICARRYKKLKK
jgi:hypothetical protein